MKSKKTTIDDLARIIEEEFLESRAEAKVIEKNLANEIESLRLEVEQRLDSVEKRLFRIEMKLMDDHEERLGEIETRLHIKTRK